MSRKSGSFGLTAGCLVVMGVYAFLVSLAFIIVTIMYVTNQGCEEVVGENASVKSLVHEDILNQDNSHNGDVTEKAEKEGDHTGHTHAVICDCGRVYSLSLKLWFWWQLLLGWFT